MLLLLIFVTLPNTMAQTKTNGVIASIAIETGTHFQSGFTLAEAPIKGLEQLSSENLTLFRIYGHQESSVPFQICPEQKDVIYWLPEESANSTLQYELRKKDHKGFPDGVRVEKTEGRIDFTKNDKTVLTYQAEEVFPPEGFDEAYKRSGFIHPLHAPDGTILTQIQPEDHLHHYGIWNPWTNTTFREETVDFWNLRKMEGTVKHTGIFRTTQGPVFSEVRVVHEHIAWPESTRQTIAMKEWQTIRVYNSPDGFYMIDFDILLQPQEDFTLEEFRYGGFVFRGTEAWHRETSDFITSEGLDRDHADGQRARWCIVNGESISGSAGILFMGHPDNYNHPEPLRVWPSDANNGRGDVFINFSPTRNTRWPLEAYGNYRLRYRLVVFNGELPIDTAESIWQSWAKPPQFTLAVD